MLLRRPPVSAFDALQLGVEIGVRVAVGDVERVDALIPRRRGGMFESDGEFSQDVEVGRAFDVEHVVVLLRAHVVLGPVVR